MNTKTKEASAQDVKEEPKTTGQELVSAVSGEIADASTYAGYEEDAGGGLENQTQDDVGIPYLVLLQPLSPEVSAEGSEAKPGSWCNRGVGEFFPEGVPFVPAYTRHVFREWSSREPSGSAPVGDHEPESELIQRVKREQAFGQYTHPDTLSKPEKEQHPLVETFEVYGLNLREDGSFVPSVVTFSSTHIRPYRDWMLKLRSIIIQLPNGRKITPPMWAHVYRFTSKRVEKKPNVWWVPEIAFFNKGGATESRLLPTDDAYIAAKKLKEMVEAGTLRAALPTREQAGEEALQRGDTSDEKAPY